MMSFQIGEGSPRLRARTSDAANGGAYASSQRCDMANDLARIWHARKMNDPLTPRFRRSGGLSRWWQVKDSNLRSFRDGFTVRFHWPLGQPAGCAWKDSKPIAPARNCRSRDLGRGAAMADASMDVVSKFDKQEVANAVNTAAKEVGNRYDFKNVGASVELVGEVIKMQADSEERVKAILDVVQTWLIKRGVSLKHLDVPEAGPRLSGKEYKLDVPLKEGISAENAKKINKIIRDEGPKGVKSQIHGDELRVSSKSRDDLQAIQRLLREHSDLDVALTFTNYR